MVASTAHYSTVNVFLKICLEAMIAIYHLMEQQSETFCWQVSESPTHACKGKKGIYWLR